MKAQEVRDVIVNHVIPNFDEESLFGSYVVDALNMAVNAVGAIDQIQWERDMAIKQLHDLGYGLGEKPREEANNSNQEVEKENVPDTNVGDQAVTESDLIDWYINSVDESEPVWTEEHIYELFNDFYLIPKENQ